jgi:hypothetical protein
MLAPTRWVAIIEAPTLYHARSEYLFAGLARRWIKAPRKNSMTMMRHWFPQIA